jgi:hypothetical protein
VVWSTGTLQYEERCGGVILLTSTSNCSKLLLVGSKCPLLHVYDTSIQFLGVAFSLCLISNLCEFVFALENAINGD